MKEIQTPKTKNIKKKMQKKNNCKKLKLWTNAQEDLG